jgi:hypothetical protein
MLFLLLALSGDLQCTAPFDDASHYELNAVLKEGRVAGPLKFSYVTTDGLDLKAELKVTKQGISEKSLVLEGTNGNMAVQAAADFVAGAQNYQGTLGVSFNYDGTPPVEVALTCVVKSSLR